MPQRSNASQSKGWRSLLNPETAAACACAPNEQTSAVLAIYRVSLHLTNEHRPQLYHMTAVAGQTAC